MASDACLAGLSLWAAYSLRLGGVFSDFRSTWYLFLLLPIATVALFSGLLLTWLKESVYVVFVVSFRAVSYGFLG